ncbi:MAG: alanine racemase [Lachnospiraceae bacterium]
MADALHGWQLAKTGLPLDVHLKIDTGMHRLGIPANRPEEILPLMTIPTLRVTGLFTHLCAADSDRPEDVAFTRGQIGDFFELTRQLSARGIPLPALHVQSSYGILRYPGLPCRFARPGILLYGCLSNPETMGEIPASIRPVLSWHSRIVLTRQIPEGDTVGYGRRLAGPGTPASGGDSRGLRGRLSPFPVQLP